MLWRNRSVRAKRVTFDDGAIDAFRTRFEPRLTGHADCRSYIYDTRCCAAHLCTHAVAAISHTLTLEAAALRRCAAL